MQAKDTEQLGTMSVGRLLAKLSVPAITAQLINMLYNMVDRMYIGHMEGTGKLALTGMGICMPLILVISAFAALVGYGGSPRASIYMGKKEISDVIYTNKSTAVNFVSSWQSIYFHVNMYSCYILLPYKSIALIINIINC